MTATLVGIEASRAEAVSRASDAGLGAVEACAAAASEDPRPRKRTTRNTRFIRIQQLLHQFPPPGKSRITHWAPALLRTHRLAMPSVQRIFPANKLNRRRSPDLEFVRRKKMRGNPISARNYSGIIRHPLRPGHHPAGTLHGSGRWQNPAFPESLSAQGWVILNRPRRARESATSPARMRTR